MNPILLNLPDELVSERLVLRVPRAGDGPIVAASVRASLDTLMPWLVWASEDYGDDDAEGWCRQSRVYFMTREQLPFLIFEKATGEHLGNAGFIVFDWKVRSCEIGYWLRGDSVGRGFMKEAVDALTRFAFGTLEMRRVEIRCDDRNVRSAAVAERCGYALDGILRNDSLTREGRPRSTRVYSRIAVTDVADF